MNFAKLEFYRQKIISIDKKNEVDSYELLLRKIETNTASFPQKDFIEFISDPVQHQAYTQWLQQTLKKILDAEPDLHYSLNIDHQELEYEDTFELLKNLSTYNQRLSIEITEIVPMKRSNYYFELFNKEGLEKIVELGFRIAIDDLGQGMNSITNMLSIKTYLYRVKFSLVHFKNCLSHENTKSLLLLMAKISFENDKEFVVEGIEDEKMSQWLINHNIYLHQGYLYNRPRPFFNNKISGDET